MTIKEAKEDHYSSFKNRYKPSRMQMYSFNNMLDDIVRTSFQSKEVVYHYMREPFCFTHQVVLPQTYGGYVNQIKALGII